ncbi:MAG: YhbY family RNA-binding protein [Candidatus Woesearchaeota archaeon]
MSYNDIQASVRVGKSGVTHGMLEEIASQLKKRKVLKIKFLKSYCEQFVLPQDIERIVLYTQAHVAQKKGNTVVLVHDNMATSLTQQREKRGTSQDTFRKPRF